MDEEILRLLKERPSAFVSGEEISRRLRKSRTAIWKRIQHLRSLGYEIEASTRSGYRLIGSPDLLTPVEVLPSLKTRWMGKKIHYFTRLDSTNSKAYELATQGAEEGEIVIAESQERGRGRLGRRWFSPPFLNLYLSVILRPGLPPHQAPLITLMAAVATAETIEGFSGLPPVIKWPNDLLLGGRKVAGLLNEIRSETDRVHFVILGIGVNLNVDRAALPEEIRPLATSLREETGGPVSRRDFLCLLLERLEGWYERLRGEGGERILRAWRERARIGGKRVRVTSFGEVISGEAIDIDSDGSLLLRTEGGGTRRVVAGDVEYARSER
ncbi:MAG: biotin--[acetyl-CoA-carboxylase] ligase [Desulfobacterota bacterium]|nr:biotin--[acetyl-CoA-carboxylase] ligase [Thermodesulfobacteriota bacterium]